MNQRFDSVYVNVTLVNIVASARVRELPRDETGLRHWLYQRHLHQHLSGRVRLGAPER